MGSAVLTQQQERLMPYMINIENTGLATDEQAAEVARILAAKGYDVQFTRNFGMVNPSQSCPCSDEEWESALIAADEAFPA
jgi:hypothetical protein